MIGGVRDIYNKYIKLCLPMYIVDMDDIDVNIPLQADKIKEYETMMTIGTYIAYAVFIVGILIAMTALYCVCTYKAPQSTSPSHSNYLKFDNTSELQEISPEEEKEEDYKEGCSL